MGSSHINSQPPANPALGSNPFASPQMGWGGFVQKINQAKFQNQQNLLMAQYKPVGSQMMSADGSQMNYSDVSTPQPQLNVGTYPNTIEQPKTTFNPYFGNYLNY